MAVFENKTIGEIRNLIINSIQTKCNRTFRMLPKSFTQVIATVFAGVFIVLYKQIGWLFLQLYPETAYWGEVGILGQKIRPLVMLGRLIGVGDPKTGTQWKGVLRVSVTARTGTLPAGTQLKSDITAKLYITEESAALTGEVVLVPLLCTENGSSGNLDAGDTLSFAAPLGTVQKRAVIDAITAYALDDETELGYRNRVINRFRNPPLGGALADYRKWGCDVSGVLNIYPYKDIDSPSGVLLYVSGVSSLFPDRIPSKALLIQVGEACTYDPETGKASRKPMTAVIDPAGDGSYHNIFPVRIIGFDIAIQGVSGVPISDFAEAVKPALKSYFLGREPYIRGLSDDNNKTNSVSRNNAASAVDQAAISVKAEFEGVVMYKDDAAVAGYTLGVGELAELRTLSINGEWV